MEMIALVTDSGGSASIPWLVPAIAISTLLLGTGGLVAWRRLAHDKRIGVAQLEQAEDDALSNRWRAIIEAQTVSLLKPLQDRLRDVEASVKTLEAELKESRRKYWGAISHIRTLYTWIARHLPPDFEQTQIPAPPATIAEDV